ncbi:hypothetical protein M413DRAFT_281441 [Hebeloma cylindrosporum]|uniref:Uncharacterized protein n=1 Tax=Hebeloma cylindrosporum TaxID=76867 RepID=A0A0C2XGY5_HEBCY|nr:hypothetical protein M413DRAFT_281441 [Hebeloma cylindrosporum h7]
MLSLRGYFPLQANYIPLRQNTRNTTVFKTRCVCVESTSEPDSSAGSWADRLFSRGIGLPKAWQSF